MVKNVPGKQLFARFISRRQIADVPILGYHNNRASLEDQLMSVFLGETEKGGGHF